MAGKSTKSWEAVRGQKPLNEARVATYRRLMEAEALLDPIRRRRGVSEQSVADALKIAEPDGSGVAPDGADGPPGDSSGGLSEEAAYLAALARYVRLLGGHLELRAVFGEEAIVFTRLGGGNSPPEAQ